MAARLKILIDIQKERAIEGEGEMLDVMSPCSRGYLRRDLAQEPDGDRLLLGRVSKCLNAETELPVS